MLVMADGDVIDVIVEAIGSIGQWVALPSCGSLQDLGGRLLLGLVQPDNRVFTGEDVEAIISGATGPGPCHMPDLENEVSQCVCDDCVLQNNNGPSANNGREEMN